MTPTLLAGLSVCLLGKVVLLAALSLSVLATPTPPTPYFLGLTSPDLSTSYARAISADGSVVIGTGLSNGNNPHLPDYPNFRWTRDGGFVFLHFLSYPSGYSSGNATALSADGSVVVGSTAGYPVRWTQNGDIELLGLLPELAWASPRAVSGDGSIVVGYGYAPSSGGYVPVTWTPDGGIQSLALNGFSSSELWYAVSADGSIVYGSVNRYAPSYESRLARWTLDGDVQFFDWPSPYNFGPVAVSADGSILVGRASADQWQSSHAARWNPREGGFEMLESLPGILWVEPFATSADASVIVGAATDSSSKMRAFIWTPTEGMRFLQDILTFDYGLDLTGWNLTIATGVSADGFVIVGNGTNPQGRSEAWIANLRRGDLAVVPEPATTALFALCGFALYGLRRVRQSKNTRN